MLYKYVFELMKEWAIYIYIKHQRFSVLNYMYFYTTWQLYKFEYHVINFLHNNLEFVYRILDVLKKADESIKFNGKR
jgi:hypothetical protein